MKIYPVIEKGADGMYSAYCPGTSWKNKYSFGGFGSTVDEAKEDFISSIEEIKSLYRKNTGKEADELDNLYIIWTYDIPSLFDYFPYINISRFAEKAGINPSKMRQYASGSAFPGEEMLNRILSAFRAISNELADVDVKYSKAKQAKTK